MDSPETSDQRYCSSFRILLASINVFISQVGILVMAYAAGLIISSPFVAVLGELCSNRRTPLLGSLAFMAAATVLFMETSSYPAMIAARVLQGVSGTGVWTLGLALVFDSVPEERIGTVLGYVLIGMSAGAALGPTMYLLSSSSPLRLRINRVHQQGWCVICESGRMESSFCVRSYTQ